MVRGGSPQRSLASASLRLAGEPLVWGLAILLLWEAAPHFGWINPILLPKFSAVVLKVGTLLTSDRFLSALWLTSAESAIAFCIGYPISVLVGFALGTSAPARTLMAPFFQLMFSVPKSIFMPIFILSLGIGFTQKIAYGVASVIFVVTLPVMSSLSQIPADMMRLSRYYNMSLYQRIRHIYIPCTVPTLVEGARIGVIFDIIGVIFAEMYAAKDGIGTRFMLWGSSYQLADLFAGIIIVSSITIGINQSFRYLERRVGRWRTGSEA